MKLHEFQTEFKDLITIVANKMHLPESAIERDYYIVMLLKNLADSEYAEKCVLIVFISIPVLALLQGAVCC